jgi:SAM-dependent methyltransferase
MPNDNRPLQHISIDENGNVLHLAKPILDVENLREIFFGMHFADNGALVTFLNEEPCLVEYTDEPLVVKKFIADSEGEFKIQLNHDIIYPVKKESFCIDEWDRYHGVTAESAAIPFVLTTEAQNEFFNLVDNFTDESYTWKGIEYATPEYWSDEIQVEKESYWTNIYQTENPRWDLGQPAPALLEIYPKLKLPVSRIAVIGGGSGHDAAFFAKNGHHVTLIDISAEAIARAQKQFSNFSNLHYLQADAFNLPQELYHSFDLVFEHTCYCAINPTLRNELIKVWCSLLHETGQLFGVFFTMEKRNGPPFGGSEWELKHRLNSNFKPLIWQRFKNSINGRWGKELVVLSEKKH